MYVIYLASMFSMIVAHTIDDEKEAAREGYRYYLRKWAKEKEEEEWKKNYKNLPRMNQVRK